MRAMLSLCMFFDLKIVLLMVNAMYGTTVIELERVVSLVFGLLPELLELILSSLIWAIYLYH